jgi:3-hydroxyisobutyrate dehydrogenase
MRVALLGTGLLGAAVAERLHKTAHDLTVYNRSSEKTQPLRQQGIRIAVTPREAMAAAETVLLFLSDAAAIRAVLFNSSDRGALRHRAIVQMGTIGPAESRAIQRQVEDVGGQYLEAPVLGSIAEAQAGTLLVMVGGTSEQYALVSPLLRSLGSEVRLIGPVGKAAALKLALNQLIAAEITAFAVSLRLVRQEGVAVEDLMAILRKSALFAPMFDKKLPRLRERAYDNPNFSVNHLLKDVTLNINAINGPPIATGGLRAIASLLQTAIDRGIGSLDYSALYEVIDPADDYRPSVDRD